MRTQHLFWYWTNMSQTLLIFIVAIVQPWFTYSSDYIPFSFQSGGGSASDSAVSVGDTLSNGLFYDGHHRLLYMTGNTYGSSSFHRLSSGSWEQHSTFNNNHSTTTPDCFLGMLRLPQAGSGKSPDWLQGLQFGVAGVSDSCTAIEASTGGKLSIAGNSVHINPGVLSSLLTSSNTLPTNKNDYIQINATVSGFILDFDVNGGFQGGLLIQENHEQYPVAMDQDQHSNHLFVATMVQDKSALTTSVLVQRLSRLPSSSPSSSKTSLSVSAQSQTTLQVDWQQQAGWNDTSDALIASSMVFHQEQGLLFLGGSTTAEGPAFGQRNSDNKTNNQERPWDGFIAKLNASTGEILNATRISSSVTGEEHWIWGLCAPSSPNNDDTNVANSIYAVGVTTGSNQSTFINNGPTTFTKSAFLMKLNIDTMTVLWKRQLIATKIKIQTASQYLPTPPPWLANVETVLADVNATSCAVSPDGTLVYMAGTTSSGATLDDAVDIVGNSNNNAIPIVIAAGGTDVFVAQYATSDGQLNFARQIGTNQDEWLSNGRTIVTDDQGNAILTGNTRGSLFRNKTNNNSASDLFVMSIDKWTGQHATPLSPLTTPSVVGDSNHNKRHSMLRPDFISVTVIAGIVALVFYLLTVQGLRRRRCFPGPRRSQQQHELTGDRLYFQEERSFPRQAIQSKNQHRSGGPTIVHLPLKGSPRDDVDDDTRSCYLVEEEPTYENDRHNLLPAASSNRRVTLDTFGWDDMLEFLEETSLT